MSEPTTEQVLSRVGELQHDQPIASSFGEFLRENSLEHYGIKGMRWGIRRTQKELDNGVRSEDSAAAKASLSKAKGGGVKALTNSELKSLNERLTLEQNFARLTYQPPKPSTMKKIIKGTQSTYKFLNGPGKPLVTALTGVYKTQAKAKKTAEAAAEAGKKTKSKASSSTSSASQSFKSGATAAYAYARSKNGSKAKQITDSNVVDMFLDNDGVWRARK